MLEGKIHKSEPERGNGNVNTLYFVNQARGNTRTSRTEFVYDEVMNPPGGGGYLTKFCTGRLRPQGPTPYPFIYHFGRKSTRFIYLLVKKRYPFQIPFLGSLVLIFI